MKGQITIERALAASPELVTALRRLVPQLTRNNPPPQAEDLDRMLAAATNVLLVVRSGEPPGQIVGAGAVAAYRVPTGVRAVIEDVVVDESARDQGVGEALMRALLSEARKLGSSGVSLTSNPSRFAANRLYVRLGFQRRRTNSYYLDFGS